MSKLNVTPANQWRKTNVVKLPSGAVAELRKPDVLSLMLRDGRNLPKALTQQFLSGIAGKVDEKQQEDFANALGDDPEAMAGIVNMMDMMCHAAFVNPCIADKPDYEAGQISIEDVEAQDKMWVLTWAMEGMGQISQTQNFLQGQNGSVASSPESSELRGATESDVGN